MQTKLIFLRPCSPFHLQTGGGDHESVDLYPRSDTLSAAITYWWFRQYGKVPGFPEQMPFRVSSLFPAITKRSKILRLLPKPAGISIDPERHPHKVYKRVRWFDEALFEQWLAGADMTHFLPEASDDPRLKRDGEILVADPVSDSGTGPLLKTDARTRVTLDRLTNESTPFHFVRVFHSLDILLWFYVDLEPEKEERFMGLLRILGDEGLGADRTVGMGQFTIEHVQPVKAKTPPKRNSYQYNLGIFNPLPEEAENINWLNSTYQLKTRTGWVSGKTLRRKPVPCIIENAVLFSETALKGNMPCVVDKDDELIPEEKRPDYSVYRDCRGYFISCKRD